MNEYGDRIAYLRDKSGLTQEELATKIGISRAALSHYEKNRREPDYDILSKMASFFQVSTDYLLGNEKDVTDDLIGYLNAELTNEEIKKRMKFKVDTITLSNEEVDEFIAFVRAKRFMKMQQTPASSKSEEL